MALECHFSFGSPSRKLLSAHLGCGLPRLGSDEVLCNCHENYTSELANERLQFGDSVSQTCILVDGRIIPITVSSSSSSIKKRD